MIMQATEIAGDRLMDLYFYTQTEQLVGKASVSPSQCNPALRQNTLRCHLQYENLFWLRRLYEEVTRVHMNLPTILHGDDQGYLTTAKNGSSNERKKHIDVKFNFISETLKVDSSSFRI